MAISWNIKITNVNTVSKRADVSATRTDSESTDAPQVYTFPNTPIGTTADRTSLLNTIKVEVVKAATQHDAVDAVVTDLKQTGKTALETWETTR